MRLSVPDASAVFLALERGKLVLRPSDHVKAPLATIVHELLATTERHASAGRWPPPVVVRLFNSAPLAFYHYGDLRRAEALCSRAIAVCAERFATTGAASWAGWSLQPYINLGRLAASRGDTAGSCRRFAELLAIAKSGDAADVTWLTADAVASDEVRTWIGCTRHALLKTFVTESLRALFIGSAWPDVLEFVDRLDRDPFCDDAYVRHVACEGRARALLALGDSHGALEQVQLLMNELDDHPGGLGLNALVSDAWRQLGHRRQASDALDIMEHALDTDRCGGAPLMAHALALATAVRRSALGDLRKARAVSARAIAGFERVGDEVGTLLARALRCALDASGDDRDRVEQAECDANRAALEHLARSTDYRFERAIAALQLGQTANTAIDRDEWLMESATLFQSIDLHDATRWQDGVDRRTRETGTTAASGARRETPIANLLATLYDRVMSLDRSALTAA